MTDCSQAYNADDYGSEFEPDSEVDKKKAKRSDLATKEHPVREHKPSKSTYVDEWSKDEARYMRHHYVSTNAVSFFILSICHIFCCFQFFQV